MIQIRIINFKVIKKTVVNSFGIVTIALALGAIQAQCQSVTFNFSDSTSDGWANAAYSGTPPASVVTFPSPGGDISFISIPIGGYQVANVASDSVSGAPAATFNSAMFTALENPAGFELTYSYYIDTSTFSAPGSYLQLASYVNTGGGFYGTTGTPSTYEPQFDGTQLASGSVFTGSVTVPFTAFGIDTNAIAENYFRLGLIENGDGTDVKVNFTDISISTVPEPTTLALAGLGGLALLFRRRK